MAVLSPPLVPGATLLTAPIELAGNWGDMILLSADLVVELMRHAYLGGVRLVSDRDNPRLRRLRRRLQAWSGALHLHRLAPPRRRRGGGRLALRRAARQGGARASVRSSSLWVFGQPRLRIGHATSGRLLIPVPRRALVLGDADAIIVRLGKKQHADGVAFGRRFC